MKIPLVPHQVIGAEFLAARDKCGLFDCPGLGKEITNE